MTPQTILIKAQRYVADVKQFYDVNFHSSEKFALIQHVLEELDEISKADPLEIPAKIIFQRKLLTSILPHFGYFERVALDKQLNVILNECRKITLNPEPLKSTSWL